MVDTIEVMEAFEMCYNLHFYKNLFYIWIKMYF